MWISSTRTTEFLICSPPRESNPRSGMNPNELFVIQSPSVAPMIANGTTMQTTAVARNELNRHTTINTITSRAPGICLAREARDLFESSYSPPHSRLYPGANLMSSIFLPHGVHQLTGQNTARIGKHSNCWHAIAPYDQRILPCHLETGNDLA